MGRFCGLLIEEPINGAVLSKHMNLPTKSMEELVAQLKEVFRL